MPRPKKARRICHQPDVFYFKPRGIPLHQLEELALDVDELEAVRLCDYEDLDQTVAAKKMRISQPTLARVLASARKKLAEAVVTGKAIRLTEKQVN